MEYRQYAGTATSSVQSADSYIIIKKPMLQGYKTYTVAVITIVYAVSGYFLGYLDGNAMIQLILGSGLIAGLRNAIK